MTTEARESLARKTAAAAAAAVVAAESFPAYMTAAQHRHHHLGMAATAVAFAVVAVVAAAVVADAVAFAVEAARRNQGRGDSWAVARNQLAQCPERGHFLCQKMWQRTCAIPNQRMSHAWDNSRNQCEHPLRFLRTESLKRIRIVLGNKNIFIMMQLTGLRTAFRRRGIRLRARGRQMKCWSLHRADAVGK